MRHKFGHPKRRVDLLERVQQRATKTVPGIKKLSYRERSVIIELLTLEESRTRGALITAITSLNGCNDVHMEDFFQIERN